MSLEGWRGRLAEMEPEFCAVVFGDYEDFVRICCSCGDEFPDDGNAMDPICPNCIHEGEN